MITKIDEIEYMTCTEARRKYEKNYIGMVITEEKLHDPPNAVGYVLYITDTKKELNQMPYKLDDDTYIYQVPGMAVGGLEIGAIVYSKREGA
jgi:hypothetical protein